MNAVSSAENIEYKVYRFKYKKQLNILISLTISVLGFCSFFISVVRDMNWDFLSDFRFMTINGTVFTSIISLITAVISLAEIIKGEDIKLEKFYFLRLTSVVTESIIAIVILMSLFPFIPDKPNILKYDSFNMHVIIPILTIVSFLIAEPPSEKIKPIMRFNGSALITIYSVIIVSLILWGVIPQSEIPYSFLEVNTRPLWYILLAGVIIYAGAYFLSWGYIELNKKISKSWYD
ncbi:hypothetical protein [Ruminococcus sp. JL13D9]|uniref:hypothetical protein n=1 Tax=Ruminococcus sp. JL13D9 TaxID=3233381 RepID=UPI00389B0384